jgi:hypothetical protein
MATTQTTQATQTTPTTTATQVTTSSAAPSRTAIVGRADVATFVDLVARADLNVTVIEGWAADQAPMNWIPNLPQGRYRLVAVGANTASGAIYAISDNFTILEGSDKSCIVGGAVATTKSSTTSAAAISKAPVTSPSNSSNSTGTAVGADAATKKSGISGGAIAGIVIAILAVVIIAAIIFFIMRRRKANAAGKTYNGRAIGAPSHFRKGSNRFSKFALTALGRNKTSPGVGVGSGIAGGTAAFGATTHASLPSDGTHSSAFDAEKGVPTYPPSSRRMSGVSNENPFETAPSTPVDEKFHEPLGGAAFAGAGAAALTTPPRNYNNRPLLPPTHIPTSIPTTPSERNSDAFYDTNGNLQPERDMHLSVNTTPARLPPHDDPLTPATMNFSAVHGAAQDFPSPPPVPIGLGHKKQKSTSSTTSASDLPYAAPVPPSPAARPLPPVSYGSPGSPRPVERKGSLRRKPVPKLLDDESSSPRSGGSSDDNHNNSSNNHSDHFGLNAALSGLDGGFQLIPDPPLEQKD